MFAKSAHVLARSELMRNSLHATSLQSVTAAALVCQRMTLFSNAKKDYSSQDPPKKPGKSFLDNEVTGEGDIPDSRAVEQKLPSHKQLNDELPSAEELKRALRDGKIDAYKTEETDDDK